MVFSRSFSYCFLKMSKWKIKVSILLEENIAGSLICFKKNTNIVSDFMDIGVSITINDVIRS